LRRQRNRQLGKQVDLYDIFLAAGGICEEVAKIQQIHKVLKFLPKINLMTVIYLLSFLRKLSENSETNKMNATNIAVLFAPNLLREKTEDVSIAMEDSKTSAQLMKLLIEKYSQILQPLNLDEIYPPMESKKEEKKKKKS